jgi:ethanolamine utilization protein EutA (predicted chaperonin)
VALSSSLEQQWVLDAVADYNIDIGGLTYNSESLEFDKDLDQSIVMILGCLVNIRYLKRQRSYINKKSNIITKDLSLNGTGDEKRMTKEEVDSELVYTQERINKIKQSCFVN